MSSPTENTPIHSIQDGITYQIVKENYKRTTFLSSDNQITAKNKDALRTIAKNEKIVNAEFRRQHTALMNKLESFEEKKQELGLSPRPRPESSLSLRRYSVPTTPETRLSFKLRRSTSDTKHDAEEILDTFVLANSPSSQRLHEESKDRPLTSRRASLAAARQLDPPSPTSGQLEQPPLVRPPTSLREARRMSQEIQAHTCMMAMKKFDTLMSNQGRRATIAIGASPVNLLPPQHVRQKQSGFQ